MRAMLTAKGFPLLPILETLSLYLIAIQIILRSICAELNPPPHPQKMDCFEWQQLWEPADWVTV